MIGVKPSTNEKDLTTLHSRSCLIMITEEEETLQGMEEEEVEAEADDANRRADGRPDRQSKEQVTLARRV